MEVHVDDENPFGLGSRPVYGQSDFQWLRYLSLPIVLLGKLVILILAIPLLLLFGFSIWLAV